MVLARLDKSFTGSTLARIAVEVLEEEEVKKLVQSGKVDWKETAENEDPAILWALKNEKFGIYDILAPVSKLNLQGDPSADLTVNCGSETFRVHRKLLCHRSPVFRAMMDSSLSWRHDIPELVRAADMYDLAEMVEMIRAVETGRPGRLKTGIRDLPEPSPYIFMT